MLKQRVDSPGEADGVQPPSGGCVLKHFGSCESSLCNTQPPSGGCVLKPHSGHTVGVRMAAAFRRLCVETMIEKRSYVYHKQPPSGGCVLKHLGIFRRQVLSSQPPSGGCVLKLLLQPYVNCNSAAAFRRLCVETL